MSWKRTRLTELLRIKYPIVQAPMAGSTTPALVAACSNAGVLGSFGAAALTPEQIVTKIREIKSLTDKPFGVNLFVLPENAESTVDEWEYSTCLLDPMREYLGITHRPERQNFARNFSDQFDAVLEEGVPVFSFTLNALPAESVEKLKLQGTVVIGTATNCAEGRVLQDNGVDVVVGQGAEAGGHRGTFIGRFDDSLVGSTSLIPQLVDSLRVPVVAAGGIMDGRGVVSALALGASGVQPGTYYLSASESSAGIEWVEALGRASDADSTVTRMISGQPARGLRNTLIDSLDASVAHRLPLSRFSRIYAEELRRRNGRSEERGVGEDNGIITTTTGTVGGSGGGASGGEIPPFPVQYGLVNDITAKAKDLGRWDMTVMWSGQSSGMGPGHKKHGAAMLTEALIEDTDVVLKRVAGAGALTNSF